VPYILDNHLTGNQLDDHQFDILNVDALEKLKNIAHYYTHILVIDFHTPDLERIIKENQDIVWGSLMHGGSFFDGDVYSPPNLIDMEQKLLSAYDIIYLPTNFALSKVPEQYKSKFQVCSWGLDYLKDHKPRYSNKREIDIIFPHRPSTDKGFNELLYLAKKMPQITFHITSNSDIVPIELQQKSYQNIILHLGIDRNEYYSLLNNSKIVISCSKQELFGYSVAEAIYFGAYPLLPNSQCYPELYSGLKLYDTIEELILMIRQYKQKKIRRPIKPEIAMEFSFCGLIANFLEKIKQAPEDDKKGDYVGLNL
jgi:hypothetical protein